MPLNWSNDNKKMDTSFRHVSDLHDIPFPFALSVSPRSSLHSYLFNIFRNTLSQPNMHQNKPLLMLRWPLHRRLVIHQMCFSCPFKKKKKKVIRSGNEILISNLWIFFPFLDFFAKDLPSLSFIALKIIYLFYCIFYINIWLISCWMFSRFL